VVAISGPRREAAASHLPAGTIREAIGELMCALVSDPDGPGQHAAIQQAIAGVGARAGLGSTVDWSQARVSFVRARAALELARADGDLITARAFAGELLLRSDPGLAEELASDRLGPLDDLSPGARKRLRQTLAVWLAEQGRLTSVAERLGIHPQTARYRVGRLRDLFGDALDDADARFWLEVALRIRGGHRGPGRPGGHVGDGGDGGDGGGGGGPDGRSA
jgi:hypothetical protein